MPDHLTFPIRGDKLAMRVAISASVFSSVSEFQKIEILDSEVFGRILLLDGHIQLTEFDEHAYHEALVQIPLMALGTSAKSALVVGGGDGGVLRELCKSPSIEHIDMVEIDAGVVSASKQHLPFLSDGAFEDPRVRLHIQDAFPFVKRASRKYDLIVVDSTDTYEDEEGALSEMLFVSEFYNDCLNALSGEGLVVTQSDNVVFCPYSQKSILEMFSGVFEKVGSYVGLVPSFGGYSGFVWGSRGREVQVEFREGEGFRYLNPGTYGLAFGGLGFE